MSASKATGRLPDERGSDPAPLLSGRKARIHLSVHPSAAAVARGRLAHLLREWGHDDLVETAQLVLTELVTNAGKATVGFYDLTGLTGVISDDDHALLHRMLLASDESIEVDVYGSSDSIGLAVWDRVRTPPRLKEAGENDVGGRGLALINELAAGWGYGWPRTGGKLVWATLAAPLAAPAS